MEWHHTREPFVLPKQLPWLTVHSLACHAQSEFFFSRNVVQWGKLLLWEEKKNLKNIHKQTNFVIVFGGKSKTQVGGIFPPKGPEENTVHSSYLRHLREIADGSCHASPMKLNFCRLLHSAFLHNCQPCIHTVAHAPAAYSECYLLPKKLLYLYSRYTSSSRSSWLSFITII